MFIAEGPKIVGELLASRDVLIRKIYATSEWADAHNEPDREIDVISNDELAKISQLTTANQVLAIVNKWGTDNIPTAAGRLTLALDTIQDPGNLGTIIRIADWFGIQQIVCDRDCADIYNPKVVQASMGSISRVRCYYTDLDEWLAGQEGIAILGAALAGKDIGTMGKVKEAVIVIGNESKGMSPAVMKRINEKITIPRRGEAESLNAAVATGIILSHLL